MIIKIELNEDHIKLLSFVKIDDKSDTQLSIDKDAFLINHTHLLDDVSTILGIRDKAIPTTIEDADGIALPDEEEARCINAYKYVKDNLFYLMTLMVQFSIKGGLTPGTYKAKDSDLIFEKI